ncbi:efflux transporter outer membrane subunit [Aquabacterium sp.]|uniref:efflux transporter outer membrane subunit n=1 Tax=Aquabacterium sp. TaxID=1872578 RepID=UPI0035AF549A
MNKSMTSLSLRLSVVLLASTLGACSLIPTYERPVAPVEAAWPQAQAASAVADAPAMNWQQYYPDPRLQGLIRQALADNRDMRVAILNIEQLRAQYRVTRADEFPTVNGAASHSRGTSSYAPYNVGTVASIGLSVPAYELDFFGRVRALTDVAAAQLLSTEEARKVTQISLISSVATQYYTVWADRWQLMLAERTLKARKGSLDLSQMKFDSGVLNELDLRSAQSSYETARISVEQARRQLDQDLNGLTLLVGGTVPADLLPPAPMVAEMDSPKDLASQLGDGSLWPVLSAVPVGAPSDVLLKRPDVAQAEQTLIAANANIGAARAAMFPRISLTATAGVASDALSNLFSDNHNAWSLVPSLSVPIFDMGRTQAGIDSAKVKKDIAVAQYEKTLQSAFREVANALVARKTYTDQLDAQQAQTAAEAARYKLSLLRYDSGVANQLDLLDAQRSLFSAQQSLISAQLSRQLAHVSLYAALGGGWDASGTH